MRRLPGPAGLLAVEEHGQGPLPLLLIHGMAGDASFWASMVRALGPGYRVIIPELRGHGRSGQPSDGQYAIAAHAADLVAVVEAMALDRVVLVGHSFGASVALEAATLMPTQVAGMVLLDAAGDFSYVPPKRSRGSSQEWSIRPTTPRRSRGRSTWPWKGQPPRPSAGCGPRSWRRHQ